MSREDEPMEHQVAVRRAWNAASRGDTALAQAWAMIAGQLEYVPQAQQACPDCGGTPGVNWKAGCEGCIGARIPVEKQEDDSRQYDDGLRINPIVAGAVTGAMICFCRGDALAHRPGGFGCTNGKAGVNEQ